LDTILGVDSTVTRSAGSTVAQLFALLPPVGGRRLVPLALGLTVILAATAAAKLSRAPPRR